MKIKHIFYGFGLLCCLFVLSAFVGGSVSAYVEVPSIAPLIRSQKPSPDLVVELPQTLPDHSVVPNDKWIGKSPENARQTAGRVILTYFWNAGCPTCYEMVPVLNDLTKMFDKQNFSVLSVYTPSDRSQSDISFVENVAKDFGIRYLVGFDDEYKLWSAYHNRFWPSVYLFDETGTLRYWHYGNPPEDELREEVYALLGLRPEDVAVERIIRDYPWTYFGYVKIRDGGGIGRYGGQQKLQRDVSSVYTFPTELEMIKWAIQGEWTVYEEQVETMAEDGRIRFHFSGPTLAVGLERQGPDSEIDVLLDGQYVPPAFAGSDLYFDASGRSYAIAEAVSRRQIIANVTGDHLVELIIKDPGVIVVGAGPE